MNVGPSTEVQRSAVEAQRNQQRLSEYHVKVFMLETWRDNERQPKRQQQLARPTTAGSRRKASRSRDSIDRLFTWTYER